MKLSKIFTNTAIYLILIISNVGWLVYTTLDSSEKTTQKSYYKDCDESHALENARTLLAKTLLPDSLQNVTDEKLDRMLEKGAGFDEENDYKHQLAKNHDWLMHNSVDYPSLDRMAKKQRAKVEKFEERRRKSK